MIRQEKEEEEEEEEKEKEPAVFAAGAGLARSGRGASFMRHRLMWLVLEVAIFHGCS